MVAVIIISRRSKGLKMGQRVFHIGYSLESRGNGPRRGLAMLSSM